MHSMPSEAAGLRDITRRHFFSRCGVGVGSMALASLLADEGLAAIAPRDPANPLNGDGPVVRDLSAHRD